MKQETLEKILKIIIIAVAVCGAIVFLYVIPHVGKYIVGLYPEFSSWYVPWLIFVLIAAVPCYAVLVLGWQIALRIGKDDSFCMGNARSLKYASILAVADSVYFFAGNIILWLCGKNHPSIVAVSLLVVLAGLAFATVAAVLSYLVQKAALIKQENDLTI